MEERLHNKYFFLYFSLYNLFESNGNRYGHKLAIVFLSFANGIVVLYSATLLGFLLKVDLRPSFFFILPIILLYLLTLLNSKILVSILFRQRIVNYFSKQYVNSYFPKLVAILLFVFVYIYTIIIALCINLLR